VALRNLAAKQAGQEVDWIRIADARALTDLGLAERDAAGWHISPAGTAALANADRERPTTVEPAAGASGVTPLWSVD